MKNVLSITEARKKLPSIIKSLKTSPGTVYQITVHDEVVAEIKTPASISPGEAAAKLLAMRKKLKPKRKGYILPISENIKEQLYVAEKRD
jgi:antitoxin (DNA-binding transcriptional repressor) of toxin-antitoxin stability system